MRTRRIEHLITFAVVGAVIGLSLPDGGFAPTAVAAAALIVWLLIVVGLATGVVPRAEPPPAAVAAGLCLAGFAGLIALSMVWASDDGRSFEDAVRALAYLGVFVLVVAASRVGGAVAWLRGLAIGLAAVGAIALLARFEPSWFGDPDVALAAELPATAGRLSYPLGYWNGLAASMAAAVALLVWFGAAGADRRGRALAVGALPAVVLALWATDSRGGIVAAALAVLVLLAAGPVRPRLLAALVIGVLGGLALIGLALGREQLFEAPGSAEALAQGDGMLALTIGVMIAAAAVRYLLDAPIERFRIPDSIGRGAVVVLAFGAVAAIVIADPVQRFGEFKAPPEGLELRGGQADLLRTGSSGRYQFWETAVDAFATEPVHGLGSGGYGPYWLEHREYPITATRAHSLILESLAELGIAGLALIIGFGAIAAIAGISRCRDPAGVPEVGPALAVLAVGFAAASVDWTWDLPAVFGVTVVAAALLGGPATLAGGAERPRQVVGTARSRRRFAGGVAVLVVAWLSICASGLLLLADHSLESSQRAVARGDLQDAVEEANDAIDLEPWAAAPRTQLALVFEDADDLEAAREAIGEAIERSPRDYELYLLRSRFEAAAGDRAAAGASLARAAELNPLDAEIREEGEGSS